MLVSGTVFLVHRRLATLAIFALAVTVAACGGEDQRPVVSLFDLAAADTETCALEPEGSLAAVLPVLAEPLEGVDAAVEAKDFPSAGVGSRSVTCVWDSSAGFVTLSVVKGDAAPAVMLAAPVVSLSYGGIVAFVPMRFAEALAVQTAPDEVVVLTAPGLVTRDMLIAATKVITLPARVEWPEMRLPQGARPNVDVFRTGVAVAVCGKKITIRPSATQGSTDAAFVSNIPGVVDVFPASDADGYALATMKRVLRAAPVSWETDGLHVAAAVFAPVCENKAASAWGWVWDDPTAKTPAYGPVPLSELYVRPVLGNAWRILVEVASEKPSAPAYVPVAPEVEYSLKRTSDSPPTSSSD